jgi:hypothetical protein
VGMGGGTGTGPKSLEEKAVEVEVNGVPTKVVSIEGFVTFVKTFSEPITISPKSPLIPFGQPIKSYRVGYQKKLHISLDPEKSTENIGLLKFKGTSSVEGGDHVRASLILEEYIEKSGTGEVLYIEKIGSNGIATRRDYMDGYKPTRDDLEKLRLP